MAVYFLTNEDLARILALLETKANKSDIKTKFSADDIIAGILPIKFGGTSGTTPEEARNNLGIPEWVETYVNSLQFSKVVSGSYDGLYAVAFNAAGTNSVAVDTTFSTPSRCKGMIIWSDIGGHFAIISAHGDVIEYYPRDCYVAHSKGDETNFGYTLPQLLTGASASITDNQVVLTTYRLFAYESKRSYLSYYEYTYNYIMFL